MLIEVRCYSEGATYLVGVGSMTVEGLKRADAAMRPDSVVWYERLAWAAVATGLATSAANPALLARNYERYANGFLAFGALSITAQLVWIWLVARKRQNWARWISLVTLLIGIPVVLWDNEERLQLLGAISAIFWYAAYVLHLISVLFLFRGDAREWFSRNRFH